MYTPDREENNAIWCFMAEALFPRGTDGRERAELHHGVHSPLHPAPPTPRSLLRLTFGPPAMTSSSTSLPSSPIPHPNLVTAPFTHCLAFSGLLTPLPSSVAFLALN